MALTDVAVHGVDELTQRLRAIGEKAGRREAVRIMRKGAPPIKKEMKRLAPVRTGRLRDSIITKEGKKYRDLGATLRIGPRLGKGSKSAPHAHLVELGTRAGQYKTQGRFSIFRPGGEIARVKTINHPGVKAQRFIEKAFDRTADEAAERITREIDKIVQR